MRVVVFIFLLLLPSVLGLNINEIMYNPPGSDNNLEFVELYDENELDDLSEWVVGDLKSNDTLVLASEYVNSDYALIVEEGFDFGNVNVCHN